MFTMKQQVRKTVCFNDGCIQLHIAWLCTVKHLKIFFIARAITMMQKKSLQTLLERIMLKLLCFYESSKIPVIKLKCKSPHERKKKSIFHKILTQLFTVRILVYLSKYPFHPSEGAVMFPELQIQ